MLYWQCWDIVLLWKWVSLSHFRPCFNFYKIKKHWLSLLIIPIQPIQNRLYNQYRNQIIYSAKLNKHFCICEVITDTCFYYQTLILILIQLITIRHATRWHECQGSIDYIGSQKICIDLDYNLEPRLAKICAKTTWTLS